jgi:threonine synthase
MTEPTEIAEGLREAWNGSFVALTCFSCGRRRVGDLAGSCLSCRKPLRVDYDLAPGLPLPGAEAPETLWRYEAVLPVRADHAVTLGEGWTPLHQIAERVWVKDEAQNPTASFKDRGISVAVSAAKALGVEHLAAPSAGNAADSLATYGAAAGIPVTVAMPDDTPQVFVDSCRAHGAEVHLVSGSITDAGRWLSEHGPAGALDVSTLREPFRVEGKKTMAYELLEQFGGGLPEVIVYPTGGGTGLIGMWKAFDEMDRLGWIDRPPRLVSVQSEGCAPVVRAFREGASETEPWREPTCAAHGLRVPDPIGGFLCLRALRETNGTAVAVSEERLYRAADELAARSGLDVCPEGGAAWAGYLGLVEAGGIGATERVVVFNTGAGRKYR